MGVALLAKSQKYLFKKPIAPKSRLIFVTFYDMGIFIMVVTFL